MFLKTAELKKIMKAGLKRQGLIVGTVEGHYLVYTDSWGVYLGVEYASNKFKAAIMEIIGDIPEAWECYRYTINSEKDIQQEKVFDYPDPYENWKRAKDFAVIAPIFFHAWPHEYIVCQRKSDLKFVVADRALTNSVFSRNELETTVETMPERPSILDGVLYFKNETTIYWVHTESPGSKALEVLFPHLKGISFFEDDWRQKEALEDVEDVEEDNADVEDGAAEEEQLPY